MKRHGNLWNSITDPENLYLAYRKARKGKGWQKGVLDFEKDVEGNLLKLQRTLCTGEFRTSKYRSKTIHEPKKREIYILPFYPDRIVQHALLQVVVPIWDSLMMYDSYACREGKGMHEASRKTMNHVRNYKYCLKCDISKFYPSIDHNILMSIVERKIKCKPTLILFEDIIRSFDGGKNTPIGNYTSQWFGNLYMNELDMELKHEYKEKTLIRYCDDFVIFSNSKKELHRLKNSIESYLIRKLKLRFSRWSVFPVVQGVDFLGYRHFPNRILLRKSTAKRVAKRLKALPSRIYKGKITLDQYRSSIASTEGWLKWANTFNLKTSLNINTLKVAYMKTSTKSLTPNKMLLKEH